MCPYTVRNEDVLIEKLLEEEKTREVSNTRNCILSRGPFCRLFGTDWTSRDIRDASRSFLDIFAIVLDHRPIMWASCGVCGNQRWKARDISKMDRSDRAQGRHHRNDVEDSDCREISSVYTPRRTRIFAAISDRLGLEVYATPHEYSYSRREWKPLIIFHSYPGSWSEWNSDYHRWHYRIA